LSAVLVAKAVHRGATLVNTGSVYTPACLSAEAVSLLVVDETQQLNQAGCDCAVDQKGIKAAASFSASVH